MGNVLSVNGPNEYAWGNKNTILGRYLNNRLMDIDPNVKKRGCCMALPGKEDHDGKRGIPVPISNIMPKNAMGNGTKTVTGIISEANDAGGDGPLSNWPSYNAEGNKMILGKNGMPMKRVTFEEKDRNDLCTLDGKTYNPPLGINDDTETADICDAFYAQFCADSVLGTNETVSSDLKLKSCVKQSTDTSVGNEIDLDVLHCANEYNSKKIFPNAGYNKSGAFNYPEDCSCFNAVNGPTYNQGDVGTLYNVFETPLEKQIPVAIDKVCTNAGPTPYTAVLTLSASGTYGGAYLNKRSRKWTTQQVCLNEINFKNVENLHVAPDGIDQTNSCPIETGLTEEQQESYNDANDTSTGNNDDGNNDDGDDGNNDDGDDSFKDTIEDSFLGSMTNFYILIGVIVMILMLILLM